MILICQYTDRIVSTGQYSNLTLVTQSTIK